MNKWQLRIFSSVWITYFAFYLCRYNMSMAKTRLCDTYSWDGARIGMVFTALTAMYALGQFVNGQLADRFGARRIASLGVAGSVVMNLAVFFLTLLASETTSSDTVLLLLVVFWGANGYFQSMGWSPMVKIMAHWFPASRRGKVMGLLGASYQFGGAFSWFLAFFLVGYFVQHLGGDWRAVFWVPAVLFAGAGILFFLMVRNSPEDAGLLPAEAEAEAVSEPEATAGQRDEQERKNSSQGKLAENIVRTLKNPYIWIVAFTFFLLDMNRYGFVNWLPAFLEEHGTAVGVEGFEFKEVMKRCIHPLAGAAGAVVAGWATDRFFGGRRAPVIAMLLLLLGVFSILFPYIDPSRGWAVILVIALIGFCTYGPHILMVGHAAQDFGRKSGAAGAAGFIDGMGYIGASLAGWGAGVLIMKCGYGFTFVVFGAAAILGAFLVCLIWKVGPETRRGEGEGEGSGTGTGTEA